MDFKWCIEMGYFFTFVLLLVIHYPSGTYFSLVALSPLINLEIAWDTCQLPGFSYECLQVFLVLFILLLNLGQWSTGVFANSEAILWSFANVGNNQISPNLYWTSRVSPGFTRSKWITVYRRILFQQTNANWLTHIQAPYLQNIMITSLIGFQLLRSAQLNQCGQIKRIFHLASNKSTNIQQIYSSDFHSGLSWFVLKFELFSQLIFTCLFNFCCKHPSRAGQSCKAFANFSSFSWHTYLVWNGPRPLSDLVPLRTPI